ncbi:WYL domain-containing protein [Yersinia enterocolitica]|nr:WYL domain-containing protein [Yersinia enterocolitica]QBJ11520.1 WYL domain-containing protein [Rahnella aquatilis]EKN3796961.1 WYL domain-containing protein [Yersinia enterocolitica]EKN3878189.1 WYL domain-containing protein [Yersinia enterocolitica]EKN4175102.1 WYL domain-containing protein [Yersinia enterocolitica]
MSTQTTRTGHWGQQRRLEFIDFRLLWEGRLNRSDITTFFRISVPQASLDLAKYQELAPFNASYNRTQKSYIATPDFKPVLATFESNHYLNELLGLETGILSPTESFIGWAPPVAGLPLPTRKVQPEILIHLITAVKKQQALVVDYRAMRDEPSIRTLLPTAFAHDGHRWHIRAYCFSSEMYKDFVLGRFFSILDTKQSFEEVPADVDWDTFIDVVIGPNPEFSVNKKMIIERDYQMDNGEAKIRIRKAQYYYLKRRLNLNDEGVTITENQQIILLRIEQLVFFSGKK